MSLLDLLNTQQKDAVLNTEGALLILAGAGSGKTRVIINRIAYLIQEKGVYPSSILAVTFTNKAAEQMRDRIRALLLEQGSGITRLPEVSTFHALCVKLLRIYGDPLSEIRPGFTRNFNIADSDDQLALVKRIYRQFGLTADAFMKPRSALSEISRMKNQSQDELISKTLETLKTPVAAAAKSVTRSSHDRFKLSPDDIYEPDPDLMRVFHAYQKDLNVSNALDFDDLLIEILRLLNHSQETRAAIQSRYQYLLVDEYQDTNQLQYMLIRILSQHHGNVCVVGDEDQSIYSWRGADIRNILNFESDFINAKTIRMEQNYRSTKRILAAASELVANNIERKGKTLWTEGSTGARIQVFQARDAEEEAYGVVTWLSRMIAAEPYLNAAILYRTHAQSRMIEDALLYTKLSYVVVGNISFYKRKEVKDILAYLKAAVSPQDSISVLRIINVPTRGISKPTVEKLQSLASDHGISFWDAMERAVKEELFPARVTGSLRAFRVLMLELRQKLQGNALPDVLQWVADVTGYRQKLERDTSQDGQSRLENMEELINAATESSLRGEPFQEFLDHASLVSDQDMADYKATILLMTLHSAKGLEFPVVVMSGMEEQLFPWDPHGLAHSQAIEEERRLCYVGMTRAERQLLLTHANRRMSFGSGGASRYKYRIPSRFLAEIPDEFKQDWSPKKISMWESPEQVESSLPLVSKGSLLDRANGTVFGKKHGRYSTAEANCDADLLQQGYRVQHEKFGVGTLLKSEGTGEDTKVTVLFADHGKKKLLLKYANLRQL